MTELGASAKALIAAARDGLGPDPAAIARMRAGIASATAVVGGTTAAVGHGGATAVGASTGATASVAAATGATALVKIAIVAVVAIAATGTVVGVALHRREVPTVVAAPLLTVPTALTADSAVSGGDLHVAVIVRDPDQLSAPAVADSRTLAVQRPAPGQASDGRTAGNRTDGVRTDASRTTGARTDGSRTADARTDANRTDANRTAGSPTPAIDLAREVALLDPAMKAMRRGDPAAALAAVGDYEREVGDRGQLAEDAAALALEALCASGAPADQRVAIEQRWPNAAQRRRVRTACARGH